MPGAQYLQEESITRRQQLMKELEDTWWRMWITQALPFLVPYKKWRTVSRNLCVDDIVLVLYDRKVGKADYRLARILDVHPDEHGTVRTVTVGMRRRDKRETGLPYQPRPLEKLKLGVQRLAVICPVEVQYEEAKKILVAEDRNGVRGEVLGAGDSRDDTAKNLVAEDAIADAQKILEAEERSDDMKKILVAEERTSRL